MTFAVAGVDIVTPFRIIERGSLLVDGKKIAAIGSAGDVRIPNGTKTYDFDGMTLTPGYIDLLVHRPFRCELRAGSCSN
jgi:imidazolonepropionase-like amidohydrolase